MKPDPFDQIARLRDTREQRGLSDVQISNQARDTLQNAADVLEVKLVDATRVHSSFQAKVYTDAVGSVLTLRELDIVEAKLAKEQGKVETLAKQHQSVTDLAERATSDAEAARDRYSILLQSKKKWDRVIEVNVERRLNVDIADEELELENIPIKSQS